MSLYDMAFLFKKYTLIYIVVFLISVSAMIFSKQNLFYSKIHQANLPPIKALQNLTFGLKKQVADTFWLRAVQDFDYCENVVVQATSKSPMICGSKSWLFQTLDMATVLDPKLEPVMYQAGGLALTVIISDYAGASVIFDKGVAQYPTNWQLLYSAAYHALFEEKDKIKASRLYLAAVENGAPSWVKGMAARLATEGGDLEFAQRVLADMIKSSDNEIVIKRLKAKLEEAQSATKNK